MVWRVAFFTLLCLAFPRGEAEGIGSKLPPPSPSQAVEGSSLRRPSPSQAVDGVGGHEGGGGHKGIQDLEDEGSSAPNASTSPHPHLKTRAVAHNKITAQVSRGEHQSLAQPEDMPDVRGGTGNEKLPHDIRSESRRNGSSLEDGGHSKARRPRTSTMPPTTQKPKVTQAPQVIMPPAPQLPPTTQEPKATSTRVPKLPASSLKNPAGPTPVAESVATPDFRKVELQDGTWDLTTSPFSSQADLQKLWSHLFSGYRKELPPIPLDLGPLAVGIGINFMKIKDLDEVEGSLNIALALRLCWDDVRLSFDAEDYFNKSWTHEGDKLPLDPKMVWTPDITVLNIIGSPKSLSDSHSSPLVLADDLFRYQTGVNVLWSRPLVVSSQCNVDMSKYPFDQQACDIIVGSWTRSRRAMLLVPQKFFAEYTIHSSEFKVANITVVKRDVYTKGSAQTFNEVVYRIVLLRYPHYHVVNFILPMLSITLLTVGTMWMNSRQTGQRVNSGTKLLLCIVSIMFITARGRPALHGDIWMDRFQSHCLAVALSSVLQSLFIDHVSNNAGHISWMPHVDTIDIVLRSVICFMTGFTVHSDAAQVNLSDVPDCSWSANLLMAFIYLLASTLAVSSIWSMCWLLLKLLRGTSSSTKDGVADVPLLSVRETWAE